MKKIESINNPIIKNLFKLHDKKYRDQERKFLIEGYHLVNEAKRSNLLNEVLICSEEDFISGVENILVSPAILEKIAFTKTPQKIIGICDYFPEKDLIGNKFLLLDDIQDPGNLGALVRSGLGFNIDFVILGLNSVDIYNDKFIRSTQGALFHVNLIKTELCSVIKSLKEKNITIIGTTLENGIPISNIKIPEKYALILGNEGNGINKEILSLTDFNVYIETNTSLESLNVSVAGGILMFYLNQKRC